MGYFPFFVDIENEHGLVIGGGEVALRKLTRLEQFGPKLTVIAEDICEGIRRLAAEENEENAGVAAAVTASADSAYFAAEAAHIAEDAAADRAGCAVQADYAASAASGKDAQLCLLQRSFTAEDLDAPDICFVIAATDDKAENHAIAELCKKKNIPVNSVDSKEDCSFIFPSLIKKGSLTIGISTGGASPFAARDMRMRLEDALPERIDEILESLSAYRPLVKERTASTEQRMRINRELYRLSMQLGRPLDTDECEEVIAELSTDDGRRHFKGCVYITGAGCGSADWLTVKAKRLISGCDAVLYDALIDKSILKLVPESCMLVETGKRGDAGYVSMPQEEINSLMIKLAMEGKRVVRLKGGDPLLFGRGGEEAIRLKEAGIEYEIIPGITSALAIPLEAGIPVTHRGVSRSVHIVTAHTAGDVSGERIKALAGIEGTLVFLMGLERIKDICSQLINGGKDPLTSATVISGGNSLHRSQVRGNLGSIAELAAAADVKAPAVIVIGETAGMDLRNSL